MSAPRPPASPSPVNLEVRVRTLTPQVAAVELIGEADIYTTYLAKEAMLKLLEAGARHLVIDLKGADYLDSTALGLLVGMLKRVREREGSLRLVGPKARVRKVFEITRLDQVFPIFESEAEAIAGIAQEEKP